MTDNPQPSAESAAPDNAAEPEVEVWMQQIGNLADLSNRSGHDTAIAAATREVPELDNAAIDDKIASAQHTSRKENGVAQMRMGCILIVSGVVLELIILGITAHNSGSDNTVACYTSMWVLSGGYYFLRGLFNSFI